MAIGFLSGAASILGGLRNSKIKGVKAGTKIVKPPKTVFGKLFGSITGRTQAAKLQKQMQAQKDAQITTYSPQQNKQEMFRDRNGLPVAGSVQFGQQTKQANIGTLALLGGVAIAVVYFITNTGRRRGRR